MPLRAATQRLDDLISAVVLAFSGVVWALAGFPYQDKVIAFGILAAVCIGALKWRESRP